jgi:hypothetical protein
MGNLTSVKSPEEFAKANGYVLTPEEARALERNSYDAPTRLSLIDDYIDLSPRALNALRAKFGRDPTFFDLYSLNGRSFQEINNVGRKSWNELNEALQRAFLPQLSSNYCRYDDIRKDPSGAPAEYFISELSRTTNLSKEQILALCGNIASNSSRNLDKAIIRMPDGMRRELKIAAARNNRSLNAEIVHRLALSMARESCQG